MTKEEFLKNFTEHVKEAKKYYNRDKFLQCLKEGVKCPFRCDNLEKETFLSSSLRFRGTNKFINTSYYYIFHRYQLQKEIFQIVEKEWKEET